VLKKVSPKIWLPALTVAWGIVTMCLGFVKNYTGFMIVRAVLGLTEGGLLPGIVSSVLLALLCACYSFDHRLIFFPCKVLYLSGMYTRPEMALRIGLFYTSASLSGAFGGRFLQRTWTWKHGTDGDRTSCQRLNVYRQQRQSKIMVMDLHY